jgi:hypothetical protein
MSRLVPLEPDTSHGLWHSPSAPAHRKTPHSRRFRNLFVSALLVASVVGMRPSTATSPAPPGKAGASAPGGNPAAVSIPVASATKCSTRLALISIDRILTSYDTGDWTALQNDLLPIVDRLRKSPGCTDVLPTDARASFALINDHLPKPTVIRILAGTSPRPDFYSKRLIKGPIFTIYLYRNRATPITSTYAASPSASPVEAGVSQLLSSAGPKKAPASTAQVAVAPVKGLSALSEHTRAALSAILATPQEPDSLSNPLVALKLSSEWLIKIQSIISASTVDCDVSKAILPPHFHWGQVTVTDTINTKTLLTPQSVADRVRHRFGEPETLSPNVLKLTDTLRMQSSGHACQSSIISSQKDQTAPGTCEGKLNEALAETLKDALSVADMQLRVADIESATAVFAMYSAILDGAGQVDAQTAYVYGNLTHASFGLGIGVMAHPNLDHQAKLAPGNVLIDDTPNGIVTSANFYYSCSGYDETTLQPVGVELLPKFVAGIVITPNVGLFVGASESVWFFRSLSFNAGYALMLANVLPSGTSVGDVVTVKGSTGIKHGALGAWMLELGYSF